MQTTRIQIPETVEYALTKDLGDVMYRRSIRSARSGVENGMRFVDYHANPVMIAKALDALFNRAAGQDTVIYKGMRKTVELQISNQPCAPPKGDITHVFTVKPV